MKKVLLSLALVAFVGATTVSFASDANGVSIEKTDKKKKKKKKKACCAEKKACAEKETAKKGCCSKEGAAKTCTKKAAATAE